MFQILFFCYCFFAIGNTFSKSMAQYYALSLLSSARQAFLLQNNVVADFQIMCLNKEIIFCSKFIHVFFFTGSIFNFSFPNFNHHRNFIFVHNVREKKSGFTCFKNRELLVSDHSLHNIFSLLILLYSNCWCSLYIQMYSFSVC